MYAPEVTAPPFDGRIDPWPGAGARAPAAFRTRALPVLDQGLAATCTGHACATLARVLWPDAPALSPEMVYHFARLRSGRGPRDPAGASLESALAAWCQVGALPTAAWRAIAASAPIHEPGWTLDPAAAAEARSHAPATYRPVDRLDVAAVRAAILRRGAVAAALDVHDGWHDLFTGTTLLLLRLQALGGPQIGPQGAAARGVVPARGRIPWPAPDSLKLGRHAVAVIGYDADGFWVQNSLGLRWGEAGCGHVSLADWRANAREVWEVTPRDPEPIC